MDTSGEPLWPSVCCPSPGEWQQRLDPVMPPDPTSPSPDPAIPPDPTSPVQTQQYHQTQHTQSRPGNTTRPNIPSLDPVISLVAMSPRLDQVTPRDSMYPLVPQSLLMKDHVRILGKQGASAFSAFPPSYSMPLGWKIDPRIRIWPESSNTTTVHLHNIWQTSRIHIVTTKSCEMKGKITPLTPCSPAWGQCGQHGVQHKHSVTV